jgi:hypothetical protein
LHGKYLSVVPVLPPVFISVAVVVGNTGQISVLEMLLYVCLPHMTPSPVFKPYLGCNWVVLKVTDHFLAIPSFLSSPFPNHPLPKMELAHGMRPDLSSCQRLWLLLPGSTLK